MARTTPDDSGDGTHVVARNPKANHDYHILETWEAGLVLTGTEVKSLRSGKASIKEAYAHVRNGEAWIEGLNITPYEQGNRYNHDPVRTRRRVFLPKRCQLLGCEGRGDTDQRRPQPPPVVGRHRFLSCGYPKNFEIFLFQGTG